MPISVFIEDDDEVISKTSFEYFEELIEFREAYSQIYDEWKENRSKNNE